MDKIILTPKDIDITKCPVHKYTGKDTFILGAFNPGMERLPNNNVVLMVRVAEALKEPIWDNQIHTIRWDNGYHLDGYNLEDCDTKDPRKFYLKKTDSKTFLLTSLSFILPVELSEDASKIIKIHYDKIIEPTTTYQEYGVEDARITKIEDRYKMTTCSVSSERHSTTLYDSEDGLNWNLRGIIFDHQNKDVLLFPRKINNLYYALTRPVGTIYFNPNPDSNFLSGPSINLAESPDLLHWKPTDLPFIRPQKNVSSSTRLGGGAQPIEIEEGFIILFHGVEKSGVVGKYETYGALLDKDNPNIILKIQNQVPIISPNQDLTNPLKELLYVHDVVFTTGIIEYEDSYIIANGEADLCCRIVTKSKQEIKDYLLS